MRKVICAEAELIEILGVSNSLSVTTFGSLINAVLGAVSGVVVDVSQSGAAPTALLATQPAGNAGAVTPSKFSFNTVAHGDPPAVAVAVAVLVAVAVAVLVAVLVAVAVAVGVKVAVAVAVDVAVGVEVAVDVGVAVAVAVGVKVAVAVAVDVAVAVGVALGEGLGPVIVIRPSI